MLHNHLVLPSTHCVVQGIHFVGMAHFAAGADTVDMAAAHIAVGTVLAVDTVLAVGPSWGPVGTQLLVAACAEATAERLGNACGVQEAGTHCAAVRNLMQAACTLQE